MSLIDRMPDSRVFHLCLVSRPQPGEYRPWMVAVDLPGHGGSARPPPAAEDLTILGFALFLQKVLLLILLSSRLLLYEFVLKLNYSTQLSFLYSFVHKRNLHFSLYNNVFKIFTSCRFIQSLNYVYSFH